MNLEKSRLHSIKDSPFYLLKGKGKFSELLFVQWESLNSLLSNKNSYKVFINKAGREIQYPQGELKRIHKRIATLLARIKAPSYLTSTKGFSYIDNAKMHIGPVKLVKTDIAKFYPSTTFQMVYEMFIKLFKCAGDIADMLAKICCFNQRHIPTGSTLSGKIAFLSAKNMFDEIERLVILHNCILSIYVDDITVSGNKANGKLLWEVKKIIKKHGYSTKRQKSKLYKEYQPKTITGAVIKEWDLLLPNRRHKKIWETTKEYRQTQDKGQRINIKNRLDSMVREANKILLAS